MKYYEVIFTITPCSQDARDILSAMAGEAGFETFEETDEGLTGYVQQQLFDQSALDDVLAAFPFEGTHIIYKVREAEDRDWNEQWEQEGFEPIVIRREMADGGCEMADVRGEMADGGCRTLVIHDGRHLPSDINLQTSDISIEIDAHLAFGTGTHETTRMICGMLMDIFNSTPECTPLSVSEGFPFGSPRVLDCGSGTGILGICALKLGAASCVAYDIDEWSVDNTRHNAVINLVDDRLTVFHGDATLLQPEPQSAASDPDAIRQSSFDLVMANINRNILLQDMERFVGVMSPKATLILSGFYRSDCPLLEEKAHSLGLTHCETRHDGDWACMRFLKALLVMLLMFTTGLQAGNKIFTDRVKSLTSVVNGDWLNRPVMTLGSSEQMVVGFDELSHNYHRFVYRLEHCEADWTPSEELFESDWLDGFNNNPIDDYQNSINTTVLYTHYRLTIPNERCRLKMSGNYRLTVYDEDEGDERVLQVEFYVVEPLMDIGISATTNTDIDHNDRHQQLSLTLKYNTLRVNNLDEQLRTVVMQNWREDVARHNPSPSYITAQGLSWQHHRQLIFPAGNEYHKFEVLDVSHATMGLDRITWDGTNFQAYPYATTTRRNYLTDVDADGAFCIRNSDNVEVDYICDYVWVNYELQALWQGDIYLDGHWTTDNDRSHYQMTFDAGRQVYTASVLQKQGYYSYQYVTANGGFPPSEGCFYQTENRYQVLVYYKGTGERTWHLVGYRGIKTE